MDVESLTPPWHQLTIPPFRYSTVSTIDESTIPPFDYTIIFNDQNLPGPLFDNLMIRLFDYSTIRSFDYQTIVFVISTIPRYDDPWIDHIRLFAIRPFHYNLTIRRFEHIPPFDSLTIRQYTPFDSSTIQIFHDTANRHHHSIIRHFDDLTRPPFDEPVAIRQLDDLIFRRFDHTAIRLFSKSTIQPYTHSTTRHFDYSTIHPFDYSIFNDD